MAGTPIVPPHPGSSGAAVSARMAGLARRDTAPEVAIRRLLHARGLRYRVAYPVPGNRRRTIDIAFTRLKIAVFVDGCFWHNCPQHGTQPGSNAEWWIVKLAANKARDRDTGRHLESLGWISIRFWEHESAEGVARSVAKVVDDCERIIQIDESVR